MRYSKLGTTDLEVSRICLGTMTWGEQNSEADAHAQLDRALDAGVNFIDTAELYPTPVRSETRGLTEACIGNWLARRGGRERLVLASKVCGRSEDGHGVRGPGTRLDRANIETALDASLKRLRTDYLDLYQLHWPDRVTNYFGELGYRHAGEADEGAPLEETLGVLGELVERGKIRHVGLSNETPWGVMTALRHAAERGLPRAVSIQNPYNLLNRSFEIGLAEIAHREAVGLLAYSPLAFGVLTGKYLDGEPPPGARLTRFGRIWPRYSNPPGTEAARRYVALAHEHGMSPAQMALAFVLGRPFLTAAIVGATTLEQLDENLESVDMGLPQAALDGIERIHAEIGNPCP